MERRGSAPGSPSTSSTSASDQLRLHRQPDTAGGQLDRAPQLRGLHRPDQHLVRPQQLGESRVGGEAPVEVGSERNHDDGTTLGSAAARASVAANAARSASERQAVNSSSSWSTASRDRSSAFKAPSASASGSSRPRGEDRAKRLQRPLAGTQQPPAPAGAPGEHAASERGQEAGAQDRRLAAPRRAHDRHEAGPGEARDEVGDEALATEEDVGIGRLEARQALERADALGGERDGLRRRP